MANFLPYGKPQFFDNSGVPLAGGKLYTATAGTTVSGMTDAANYKAAYTDSTGTTNHTNPIVLDSAGREEIWLDGSYDLWLNTAANVKLWDLQNISGITPSTDVQSGSQNYGEDSGSTDDYVVTLSPGVTSYSNGLVVRLRVNTDNAAGTPTLDAGAGAKPIYYRGSNVLRAEILKSGGVYEFIYNGGRAAPGWDVQGTSPLFSGARVELTETKTVSTSTWTNINWGGENLDTDGYWASASNEKFTVPSGVSNVEISGCIDWADPPGTAPQARLWYSNTTRYGSAYIQFASTPGSTVNVISVPFMTGPVRVDAGDTFVLMVNQNSGGGADLNTNTTFMTIRAI